MQERQEVMWLYGVCPVGATKENDPAGAQNTIDLSCQLLGVGNMLVHLCTDHDIDRPISNGQSHGIDLGKHQVFIGATWGMA